ncbi:hypothetical protein [Empedobacter tilapiae]|uniref:Uncharacterized protein n=1 Tax=Empedobacter tilapiae TaxID=2491114 RepID=A0A4Z1BLI5_9FLAO|nr:hypothetical protein [Empedobacter tilapiae]TGN22995.1 hypothetical protein E4J94_15790 [Empedobacter tilapiae]
MKNIILILLLNGLFVSCKYKESKISTNEVVSIEIKDTIFIENNQVLFIIPSSNNYDEMKKRIGEENFYTIADDANFYSANAHQFLDSLKIKYKNAKSDDIVAYKNDKKTIIVQLLQEKWYTLFNKNGELSKIDLVTFEEDYKNILLKSPNKQDISFVMRESISSPKKVVDNLIFTRDKNDSLQINTKILDYISENTTIKNSGYLIALEDYGYLYRNNWTIKEISEIRAYIFNTSYPLRKKYWSDKFEEWYGGKPENYIGDSDFWKKNNYYGLPKLEEYVRDFIITHH